MNEPHLPSPAPQSLMISGMTCDGCVKSVERVLLRVPGVERALVDLSTGKAVVGGNVSTEALVEAIEAAGFGAQPL